MYYNLSHFLKAYDIPSKLGPIRLLDCEGFKAGTHLPSEAQNSELDAHARREAVKTHIPRIAYLCSDLVVYVGKKSLGNDTYFNEVPW